jgi:hypothetical protein
VIQLANQLVQTETAIHLAGFCLSKTFQLVGWTEDQFGLLNKSPSLTGETFPAVVAHANDVDSFRRQSRLPFRKILALVVISRCSRPGQYGMSKLIPTLKEPGQVAGLLNCDVR